MNKKQSKTMRKGFKEAGAMYWTKEMVIEIKKLNANRKMWTSLAMIFFTSTVILLLRVLGVI